MKLIKNSNEHAAMLKRLEELMIADPEPGSKEDEVLEILAFRIADYESRTVNIPAVMPAEAIRFRMEQAGFRKAD
jgi:HTH-type transcriptional regulator / antitoxin HigA